MGNNDKELKRCPFCGGRAELRNDYTGTGSSYIKCLNCGVESPRFPVEFTSASDDRARRYWNKRAAATQEPGPEPEEGAQA